MDERARRLHPRLRPARSSTSTRVGVIFNKAMPLEAAHMLVAAYLVGGFLIASVYAVGHAARAAATATTASGFLIAFTVAAIADPDPDGRRRRAGPLGLQQPAGEVRRHRAGAEDLERRPRDPARPAELRRDRCRRHPDPRPGLDGCRTRSTGKSTVVQGLDTRSRPTSGRPTSEVNVVHLAWDIMIGLGTLLFLLAALVRRERGSSAGTCRQSRWFLALAAACRRRWPWSRWRRAGWSPRSAANPGSSTTT